MKLTRIEKKGHSAVYQMENDRGMAVQIGTMGASIQRVELPSGGGKRVNVCLNFADPAAYTGNDLYAGATIGPVAGRIAGSRFTIGNKIYPLSPNENGTCLHGGRVNLSFIEWMVVQAFVKKEEAVLGLMAVLPEDLEGFPGNRIFSATYTLNEENRLTVVYGAKTDRETYVDMTNHAYFNFSGDFHVSGRNQQLKLAAPAYMVSDEKNLPVGLRTVEGTPFDYREGRVIREVMEAYPQDEQVRKVGGVDHAFDVREAAAAGAVLAELTDPKSGRGVRIRSKTGRCMVVYAGGSIGDTWKLDGDVMSYAGCAVALECQSFPNAVNMPQMEPRILHPEDHYRHQIEYEFVF